MVSSKIVPISEVMTTDTDSVHASEMGHSGGFHR